MNALIVAIALLLAASTTQAQETPISVLQKNFNGATVELKQLSEIFNDETADKDVACMAGWAAIERIKDQGNMLVQFQKLYPEVAPEDIRNGMLRIAHTYQVVYNSVYKKCGEDTFTPAQKSI